MQKCDAIQKNSPSLNNNRKVWQFPRSDLTLFMYHMNPKTQHDNEIESESSNTWGEKKSRGPLVPLPMLRTKYIEITLLAGCVIYFYNHKNGLSSRTPLATHFPAYILLLSNRFSQAEITLAARELLCYILPSRNGPNYTGNVLLGETIQPSVFSLTGL